MLVGLELKPARLSGVFGAARIALGPERDLELESGGPEVDSYSPSDSVSTCTESLLVHVDLTVNSTTFNGSFG